MAVALEYYERDKPAARCLQFVSLSPRVRFHSRKSFSRAAGTRRSCDSNKSQIRTGRTRALLLTAFLTTFRGGFLIKRGGFPKCAFRKFSLRTSDGDRRRRTTSGSGNITVPFDISARLPFSPRSRIDDDRPAGRSSLRFAFLAQFCSGTIRPARSSLVPSGAALPRRKRTSVAVKSKPARKS